MNKRIFYLLIVLLSVITVFSAKTYFNTKNEVLKENDYIFTLEKKLKKVVSLKNKYKFNSLLFKRLKRFCNIENGNEKYIIICKNLNSDKFNTIQNIIFKHNFKIKKFKIEKNSSLNLTAEIDK